MKNKIILALVVAALMGAMMSGCGDKQNTQEGQQQTSSDVQGQQQQQDADAVATYVLQAGGLDGEGMVAASDKLVEMYYGITSDLVDDYSIYLSEDNLNCNEVAVVVAKEGKEDEVREKMEARLKSQQNSFQDYLPEQYAIAEKGVVKQKGRFFLLAVGEGVDDMASTFDSKVQ